MVRRRARAAATPKSTANTALENGPTMALTNAQLLEDHYFGSPKRKDCKVEGISSNNNNMSYTTEGKELNVRGKVKSSSLKMNGREIVVPSGARSQTRTIDNFFKSNSTAKQLNKLNKYSSEPQKIIQPTLSASVTSPQMVQYNAIITQQNRYEGEHTHLEKEQLYQQQLQHKEQILTHRNEHQSIISRRSLDNVIVPQEFISDLSEDTNDSERADLCERIPAKQIGGTTLRTNSFDFTYQHHRSSQRADSHSSSHSSSNTSATENIFLQEPVLTLNVDKSPNQAYSIKINKTFEVEPKFSTTSSITTSVLHGRFNKIVSLDTSPLKRGSFGYEKKPIEMLNSHDYALMMLPDNDNSSCDSGVTFPSTTTSSNNSVESSPAPATVQINRGRKPSTPHRIVCCSPIKPATKDISPVRSPSTRKMTATLSSHKSQRQLTTSTVVAAAGGGGAITTAIASKARRKLNSASFHPQEDHIQQLQSQSDLEEKNYIQNHDAEGGPKEDIDGDEDIEQVQQYKNISTNDLVPENNLNKHLLNGSSKSVLNSAKHPTNQQNATNNKETKHKSQQNKTKYTVQRPALKHQGHLPLAAKNGNREINDFFPVRRSVRKTKTAVKEEMMRNLEKAILEERSDGLKVAHFEGKGRGIIAERRFQRGEFVIEYVGDLISTTEAAEREKRYSLDENAGCYMYYFKHKNQQYCIDATEDTGKLGRLVNHSRNGNLMTKVVVVKQTPHLVLIAKDNIEPGEELCYDYGDRSKESLLHHPWLAF